MPLAPIRRIGPDEGELLRATRLRAVADAPDAFGQSISVLLAQSPAEWHAAARAASSGPSRAWFLAEGDSGVEGLVLGRRRPPRTLLVFSMWVAPEARRSGLGTALIEVAERWAAGWGARETVLWVVAANTGARRFYERLGFVTLRDGPDADAGRQYESVAMRRPITPLEGTPGVRLP